MHPGSLVGLDAGLLLLALGLGLLGGVGAVLALGLHAAQLHVVQLPASTADDAEHSRTVLFLLHQHRDTLGAFPVRMNGDPPGTRRDRGAGLQQVLPQSGQSQVEVSQQHARREQGLEHDSVGGIALLHVQGQPVVAQDGSR